MSEQKTKKQVEWKLIGFLVVSLAWIIFVCWLGATAYVPKGTDACTSTSFGCLTANEWGDFLAGAFAPLAFLGVVLTVLIQSQELRNQIKEMVDNRSVLKAQADQMRAQTEVLQRELHDSNLMKYKSRFDYLIRNFVRVALEDAGSVSVQTTSGAFALLPQIENKELSDERFVELFALYTNRNVSVLHGMADCKLYNPEIFRRLYTFIYHAEELLPRLSHVDRVVVKSLGLQGLIDSMELVIELDPQINDLKSHVVARKNRVART